MYDVEERRCNKVFKVCKKYLKHYQNSIFRGEITPSNLLKLKRELKRVIDIDYDKVSFIKLINQSYFSEEKIGSKVSKENDVFI